MTKFIKNIRLSLKALLLHRIRTFFAVGILAIGISMFILFDSINTGAEMKISEQFGSMGTNLLIVNSEKMVKVIGREQKINRFTTLTLNDAEAIINQCPSVKKVVPSSEKMAGKVKFGNVSTKTLLQGVTPDYLDVKNFKIIAGRFFTDFDNKRMSKVAVIGAQVQKTLFSENNPVGNKIMIGNAPFEVIGVLAPKGLSPEGSNEDAVVLIPVRTAMRRILNVDYLNRIFVQARTKELMNKAETEIETLLKEKHKMNILHKKNDFTIDNKLNAIKAEDESLRAFNWLTLSVSGVTLLLGGVGVLAIMLLSVRERIKEIGLRISIGARERDIVRQFLYEAIMLGSAGGIAGIILGSLVSLIVGNTTQWQTHISLHSIFFTLSVSIVTGLFFGVYPALRAARLDPIAALQKE